MVTWYGWTGSVTMKLKAGLNGCFSSVCGYVKVLGKENQGHKNYIYFEIKQNLVCYLPNISLINISVCWKVLICSKCISKAILQGLISIFEFEAISSAIQFWINCRKPNAMGRMICIEQILD